METCRGIIDPEVLITMVSRRSMMDAMRHSSQAWDYADKGRISEAIDEMSKAIEVQPTVAVYWVAQGDLMREAKRFEEAERAIRRALELEPKSAAAWGEYGLLFRDQGFAAKAAFCFELSLQTRPDFNMYTLLAIARLAFDAKGALAAAEAALRLEPTWDEAVAVRDQALRTIARSENEAG